ncbi:MFS transporter [Enemella evansiae]|uniref:MFS transporter n=1 Tax=Enemella evansiae TaxID=2016499 RepID=UPI000B95CE86|nr:MFS transporter [Enemella evansiae]OYO14057.1 MFS transporter [Enemella evansiae]
MTSTEDPERTSESRYEQGYHTSGVITSMQRRVLAGASVGQFIEFYDFALYAISAITLSRLFFPPGNETTALLSLFAAYGVSFFIRPVGGLVFGALGDRIGRRNVLFATLLLIGVATAGIGSLPSYHTIGITATVLLVFLRLVQGFSAGGESVGSPAFVFEHAPVDRRGWWINIALAATALPSVVASGLVVLLQTTMEPAAFGSYGWRIPFWIALPLAVFGIWIRLRTDESPAFRQMEAAQRAELAQATPVRDAFRENWLTMVQVVFVMGMTAMGFYFLSGYFISYVATTGRLSSSQSLGLNALAMLAYTILLPIMGRIGDRVGRRTMMLAGLAAILVLALPAFLLVTSGNVALALLGQLLFVLAITIYGGGCYTFFIEVFDTRTRFTSAAFSYNLGYALFGGTAPLIGTALVSASTIPYSPAFYVMGFAVLVLVLMFALRIPETRGRIS